jgi:hypothetical protein
MRSWITLLTGLALCLSPALAIAAPDQGPASPPAPAAMPDANISDGTIGKAGAALRDVAKLQQKYQGQIESAGPAQKQGLSEKANAEAVQAIQSHGLSVQEYSTVVRTAQNNPQVKQRLLDAASKE